MNHLAVDHLRVRLRPLHRILRAAVERQSDKAARLPRPSARAFCITAEHAGELLAEADELLRSPALGQPVVMTAAELEEEDDLRLRAAAEDGRLPLDHLARELALGDFGMEAVLWCAAPEIDRCYERLFAYIADDLNCRFPSVGLLASLGAETLEERLRRRALLGPYGKLRRSGLLLAQGEAATELRQELRIAPCVFEFLAGSGADPCPLLRDPAEVRLPERILLPAGADRDAIMRAAGALRDGSVRVLAVWGAPEDGADELVLAVIQQLARPALRLQPEACPAPSLGLRTHLREAFLAALGEKAVLSIDCDAWGGPESEGLREVLADLVTASGVPVILSGRAAWRPTRLLESSEYLEIEAGVPAQADRRSLWRLVAPELEPGHADRLATRFRLSGAQMRAAARVARSRAKFLTNGRPVAAADQLDGACAAVVRTRIEQFTKLVRPKRGADDLVLPADLHRQVLEIARFFLASPRVYEEWGFGRLVSGGGGLKALFTGEPGTGKSLAAEVIAGQLGLPLLKADLARLISKWVGETEKNLDAVFREAEQSHAVLFIDEAEALLGRRGEIRQGMDRFANLEISYLLQRIEEYCGLAILASNLKDQIDRAFLRRFQVILNFPMPQEAERLRIWRLAFSQGAPVGDDMDFGALSRVEMSGAAIVGSACTAALLALEEGAAATHMRHLVQGIARQFQRESRIFHPGQLGAYAALLRS